MTTASTITMVRLVMIPLFFVTMLWDFSGHMWVSLAIFILASVTDFLDGYIARKYNQVSNFGKFVDPLADKLLVTAALLIFVQWGQMPAWAAMVILTREFAVTGLRLIAVENGRVIAAAWSGKVKTAVSIVAICVMLTHFHSIALGSITVDTICWVLMVVLTLYSGAEYFIKNKDVLSFQ